MVHVIWVSLDAHPNWVVFQIDIANVFNTMWHEAIFQESQITKN
jgi:hypothetical protein